MRPLTASGNVIGAQTKTPWGCPHGVFEKPGDTYFRECSHYHRPQVLNYCVRNGNRCFHLGMVARKARRAVRPGRASIWCFLFLARVALRLPGLTPEGLA